MTGRRGGPDGAVRVKICGITRPADARMAEAAGAAWLGAVLVPGTPRMVEVEAAREIAASVDIPLALVVADPDPDAAARAARTVGARALQLHGNESTGVVARLRELGPWEIWKGIRVRSRADVREAVARWGDLVDLVLLDGWKEGRLGGTGTPFPWEAAENPPGGNGDPIRLPPGLRLGIAGGLGPENVDAAIRRLRPWLVDASSALELRPGVKDPERVRAFVAAAAAAGAGTTARDPGAAR